MMRVSTHQWTRRVVVTAGALIVVALALSTPATLQVRPRDASDRAALRAWMVALADAQFYRTTPDVTDCAALIRHAVREAVRPHTAAWLREMRFPAPIRLPDVTTRPEAIDGAMPLFATSGRRGAVYAEFVDARSLIRFNTVARGRDVAGLRPGDLLYYRQPEQRYPDHVMLFVGRSLFESEGQDWIVYHTGPSTPPRAPASEGEVRKVRLADLLRHPAPRWRPTPANRAFVGVFRLHMLDDSADRR